MGASRKNAADIKMSYDRNARAVRVRRARLYRQDRRSDDGVLAARTAAHVADYLRRLAGDPVEHSQAAGCAQWTASHGGQILLDGVS
jgi:hypothetical protein